MVSNGAYIGEILGLAVTGILCDRFGNKAVMFGATVLMVAFIFISFFGETLELQLAGQILCGIPWGAYQTVTTVYAAEVLPVALRGA
jgi:SP family general alpha glucoside:H+ symporter-like MFS transporter